MCVSAARRSCRKSARLAFLAIVVVAPLATEEPETPARLRDAYQLWQEGYQLHLAGDYEEAIERFEKSIEIHPTPEAHTFLGWSMSYLGRLEEALRTGAVIRSQLSARLPRPGVHPQPGRGALTRPPTQWRRGAHVDGESCSDTRSRIGPARASATAPGEPCGFNR
jgi:hypothetical protein